MVTFAGFSPVYLGQGQLMSHLADCGQGRASINGIVSCSRSVNDFTDQKQLRSSCVISTLGFALFTRIEQFFNPSGLTHSC